MSTHPSTRLLLLAALAAGTFAAAAFSLGLLSAPIVLTALVMIALVALLSLLRGSSARRVFVAGAGAGLAIAALAAAAITARAYMAHAEMLDRVRTTIDEYENLVGAMIDQAEVGEGDLHIVLRPLDKLRDMPLGYGRRDEPASLADTLGLGQHERLRAANVAAYGDALERLFLPRLLWRLEHLLANNIDDAAFVYEGLKVYLMLGAQARLDEELVTAWMARDWANLHPGSANAKGRERLMGHLEAMLDAPFPAVALNGPLIHEARAVLQQMPLAKRVYIQMKTLADDGRYPPWNAERRGGRDASLVFETRDGTGLADVQVPGFYTYEGFHDGLLGRIEPVVERARHEQWVLGPDAVTSSDDDPLQRIRQDVARLYADDFIAAWDEQLGRLSVVPPEDLGDVGVLSALAAPSSPLRRLLESIRDETRLSAAAGTVEATGAARQISARLGQRHPSGEASRGEAIADDIEAQFEEIHDFVGDTGSDSAPIDRLIGTFDDIYQTMLMLRVVGHQSEESLIALRVHVESLKVELQRAPEAVDGMMAGFVDRLAELAA